MLFYQNLRTKSLANTREAGVQGSTFMQFSAKILPNNSFLNEIYRDWCPRLGNSASAAESLFVGSLMAP